MHNWNVHNFNIDKYQRELPEGWEIGDKILYIPIGIHESYFVNGKEYNAFHDKDINEQQKFIREDLKKEGFSDTEIDEFIKSIAINNWRPLTLDFDESYKQIRKNPEIENKIKNIFKKLDEVSNEQLRQFKLK